VEFSEKNKKEIKDLESYNKNKNIRLMLRHE
jgi:hypothetical protein